MAEPYRPTVATLVMAAFLVALFAVLGVAGWEAAYDFIDNCIFYALLFVVALALWRRARQPRLRSPTASNTTSGS